MVRDSLHIIIKNLHFAYIELSAGAADRRDRSNQVFAASSARGPAVEILER